MEVDGNQDWDRSVPPLRSVAVIGVGSMGNPMAFHIHGSGFDLTVCDRNASALRKFDGRGVRTSVSPAECAACDAVIVLVATEKQLHEVTAAIRAAGHGPNYLVVMSTASPQTMRDVASTFAGTVTRIVDAPVSGGVVAARNGTLTVLAGGAEQDVIALKPLFAAVGENLFHCGDLGAGQMVKIVNNMIAIGNQLISAEAYRLGLASGLQLERLMSALEAGSARNSCPRAARMDRVRPIGPGRKRPTITTRSKCAV
jgi:3-hydroxyisobutyrate dehydrogenase-like beta-hydroxyacid dehydrogenase